MSSGWTIDEAPDWYAAQHRAEQQAARELQDAQAMAEKRAVLHRIAIEDPDSGSLSEDEERDRSEWPR